MTFDEALRVGKCDCHGRVTGGRRGDPRCTERSARANEAGLARIPEQDHLNSEAAAEVHRLMQATVWEALHKLAQDLDALRSQV
jgi:hypothetical protein